MADENILAGTEEESVHVLQGKQVATLCHQNCSDAALPKLICLQFPSKHWCSAATIRENIEGLLS